MTPDEKIKIVCENFVLLNNEQQEYILGILQALVFAENSNNKNDPQNSNNEQKR